MAGAKPLEPDPIQIGGGTELSGTPTGIDSRKKLTINGEPRDAVASTVRELLAALEYDGSFFAVAVNRAVVPRGCWDQPILREGDKIEIVTPRQGG
jgi:sulfur carrier protein